MTGAELIRWIQENRAENRELGVKIAGIEDVCAVRDLWQDEEERTVLEAARPDWPEDLDCPETK